MNVQQLPLRKPLNLGESLIIQGDVMSALAALPDNFVQSVVTSPPYWGLRDYGIEGQIGLEGTLDEFIRSLTAVFNSVRRVLRDDGVCWINIGDGFTSGNRGWRAPDKKNPNRAMGTRPDNPPGLKNKDLLGVPWKLAFSLQQDGWYLRSEIIWNKPNAMPESVKARPTRCHEHVFMLTKSEQYFYDPKANEETTVSGAKRNRRSVWNINTTAAASGHIAAFPKELILPCMLATSRPGDIVLDPFFGSGTVGVAACEYERKYLGVELNPEYVAIACNRLAAFKDPLFETVNHASSAHSTPSITFKTA
jgi:site-specific DNA-methyltransferase (adenine-specific)